MGNGGSSDQILVTALSGHERKHATGCCRRPSWPHSTEALNQHEEQHPASVAAVRVAALTGLRIGEILGIQWQHIDFGTGRLTLPETKTGRRVHDLPTPALALLKKLPRLSSTWAFTSTGTAAITYRTVRKHFAKIATAAGIKDVRLHDLRRTVMTWAAASGIDTHTLRDLLGHKTPAMADRYIRAVGGPVREAREQVGAAMAAMMDGEDSESADEAWSWSIPAAAMPASSGTKSVW